MTVHLDTHHAIEVMPEELGDNEEEGEVCVERVFGM